jgi:hypothetical protein
MWLNKILSEDILIIFVLTTKEYLVLNKRLFIIFYLFDVDSIKIYQRKIYNLNTCQKVAKSLYTIYIN